MDRAKKNGSILVVDDEYSIRESLKMYLNSRGYDVTLCENGEDAYGKTGEASYDVIISDIRMDGMDGVSMVKKIRANSDNTPVIFITAYPTIDNVIEAVSTGVSGYIRKPFDMSELEEKVRSTIEVRRADSVLRKADKVEANHRDFLGRFSHELRTPLTPMGGYLKLLMMKQFGKLTDEQYDVIKTIEKHGRRLKNTVEDILMLYSLENLSEPLIIGRSRITELVDEVLAEDEELIELKKQKITLNYADNHEYVFCDRVKMKRVLFHLIDNGLRFSPQSSGITISVSGHDYLGGEYIKFTVSDESDRIGGADRQMIFRMFYAMQKAGDAGLRMPHRGLGLGLTLAKAVVEAHCGMIWLEEPGVKTDRGNIFAFILPAEMGGTGKRRD